MTHKLTQFFMGAAMFASVATADMDIFAKLSNGAMSDKSEGIVELSREQKAKVVGGYILYAAPRFNYRDGSLYRPNSYQTGVVFSLSYDEFKNSYACLGDSCTTQNYYRYATLVNPANEGLLMLTRYNYNPRGYNHQFAVVDMSSGKIKRTTWGAAAADILRVYGKTVENHNASIRSPY